MPTPDLFSRRLSKLPPAKLTKFLWSHLRSLTPDYCSRVGRGSNVGAVETGSRGNRKWSRRCVEWCTPSGGPI